MDCIVVNRSAEKALRSFFPWVYRAQIVSVPESIPSGSIIKVCNQKRKILATGYVNLKSQIAIRVLSYGKKDLPTDWLERRMEKAISKRLESGFDFRSGVRLIHSEADGIPGLIVDCYRNHYVFQFNTAGIENLKDRVLNFIGNHYQIESFWEKSDLHSRKIEGLPNKNGFILGNEEDKVIIEEGKIKYQVYFREGQKTGFYLDQKENRRKLENWFHKNDRILDVFCYTGGFAIPLARKGCVVKGVDVSASALAIARENANLNNVKIEWIEANAFDFLREISKLEPESYDGVVLDPPPLAKTKRELKGAYRGLKELVLRGMKLLKSGGKLALFSCSSHITFPFLEEVLLEAVNDVKIKLEILDTFRQSKDHPIVLNMPFSWYLRGYLVRKME